MPIFNEEASIEKVFAEWLPVLQECLPPSSNQKFVILAINDGSRDNTLNILRAQEALHKENIQIIDQKNMGHGPSCVKGYNLALEMNAQWILQIDSDGQCNPEYFHNFWREKDLHPVQFGYRNVRDDGEMRWWISRVLSLVLLAKTGRFVKDPNVPYRLISSEILKKSLLKLPAGLDLANVMLSALLTRESSIHWHDIRFRDRHGGSPSVNLSKMIQMGIRFIKS